MSTTSATLSWESFRRDSISKRRGFWTTLALVVPEWERIQRSRRSIVGRLRHGTPPAQALDEVNSTLHRLVPESRDWRAVQRSLSDVIVGDVRRDIVVLSAAALLVPFLRARTSVALLLVRRACARAGICDPARCSVPGGASRAPTAHREPRARYARGNRRISSLAVWVVRIFPTGRAGRSSARERASDRRRSARLCRHCVDRRRACVRTAAPARRVARANLSDVLRTGSQPLAAGAVRRLAVVAQIALALIVVAGAGLLTRSLLILSRVEMGGFCDREPAVPRGRQTPGEIHQTRSR